MGTCLAPCLHNIYDEIDHGGVYGAFFLDLAKVLDSVEY